MTGRCLTVALAGALVAGSGGLAFAQQSYEPSNMQARPAWRTQGMRATRALNLLEDQGDGQFSNFTASGANFTADVTRNGKSMAVLIRPDLQQVQAIGSAG